MGMDVHHTLYLPPDWQGGRKFPVIVEYPGNDSPPVCTGKVEDCKLGYYASGGRNFIVMALPFVNVSQGRNQLTWWGDVDATVWYCRENVRHVCEEYGGDSTRIFIIGFSRGAIACGYIGLHDDAIASLWRGFIAYAHFDGGQFTPQDAESRLARIKGRPVMILYGEQDAGGKAGSLNGARILQQLGQTPEVLAIPNTGHSDDWIATPSSERTKLRAWIDKLAEVRA
jgi:predicted esterase